VNEKNTIFMLRHGRTGFSGRYIGARDVPLSSAGVSQIAGLQKSLGREKFDVVYASPLLRCRQSCEILFPNTAIKYNDVLREIDFGRWEGLSFEEINEQDPKMVQQWAEDPLHFTFPEGESVASFTARVEETALSLRQEFGKKVLLVCHGGIIRGLLCSFLGIDYQNALLFQVKKGRYATVEMFGEGGVLSGFNLQ